MRSIFIAVLFFIIGFGTAYMVKDRIPKLMPQLILQLISKFNPQFNKMDPGSFNLNNTQVPQLQQSQLKLVETHWGEQYGRTAICGTIENVGGIIAYNCYIEFNLYDEKGNFLGFANERTASIAPGKTIDFCCVVSRNGVDSYKLSKLQ